MPRRRRKTAQKCANFPRTLDQDLMERLTQERRALQDRLVETRKKLPIAETSPSDNLSNPFDGNSSVPHFDETKPGVVHPLKHPASHQVDIEAEIYKANHCESSQVARKRHENLIRWQNHHIRRLEYFVRAEVLSQKASARAESSNIPPPTIDHDLMDRFTQEKKLLNDRIFETRKKLPLPETSPSDNLSNPFDGNSSVPHFDETNAGVVHPLKHPASHQVDIEAEIYKASHEDATAARTRHENLIRWQHHHIQRLEYFLRTEVLRQHATVKIEPPHVLLAKLWNCEEE
eukprot:GHVL01042760.1.p1 GENE.GHVL01042760.1~~GHVL01042760.1.p1  ORF type:complete len:289 (-),score=56.90 GHVL01042760.1:178-1044(-)